MSSLGSVPDEYTSANNEQSRPSSKKKETSQHQDKSKNVPEEILQYNKSDVVKELKYEPQGEQYCDESQNHSDPELEFEKEDDGNFDTEMENEETRSSGIDVKYTLNVPSMITHLKRKDTYLESLDIFLNENLKGISDLIKIKKDVSLEIKQQQAEITMEKQKVVDQEKRTKNLETQISRTLEENY